MLDLSHFTICTVQRLTSVSVESRSDGGFDHDDADVTIIAYLFQVADEDKVI